MSRTFFKHIFLLLFCCQSFLLSHSQPDSCNLRISLLTCSPGDDLYSTFGHSALRVTDRTSGMDIIYNYGTFDFDDPDFYLKFARGKLLYYVSVEAYLDFMYAYRMENRGIVEQTLQLSCAEKHQLFEALKVNALENNKYYHYEFLFDNCTTRLREMINDHSEGLRFHNILESPPLSFRDMLHDYLDKGRQYWSKLGIDLLLGNGIDRSPSNKEAMFLPDYLMKGFDSASLRGEPLVSEKKILLQQIDPDTGTTVPPGTPTPASSMDWLGQPLTATTALLVFGIIMSFLRGPRATHIRRLLDTGFFMSIGGLGLLLLMMWFSTEHVLCADNYNLLWAWPIHLPAAFFIYKKKSWMQTYFRVGAIYYMGLLLTWPFIPQGMNLALLPVVILIAVRCAHLSFKKTAS